MKNLNIIGLISLVLLLTITGCSNLTDSTSNRIKVNTWYPVGNIIDNSTFEIMINDTSEHVTFLSLDIPDESLSQKYNLPIREFIEDRLTQSGEVKLSFDQNSRNDLGELLATVTLKDGTNLNEQLLEIGYAKVLIAEPNVQNENIYKQLEQLSKSNGYGIWSIDTETSNEDVSIRKTVFNGIGLTVNKSTQQAIVQNHTSKNIDIENWVLVSVIGNETYLFEAVTLEPGEQVIVYATKDKPESNTTLLYWDTPLVWSLNEKETAELYDKNKELMAVWSE